MRATRRHLLWTFAAAVPVAVLGRSTPRAVRRLFAADLAGSAPTPKRLTADGAAGSGFAFRRHPRIVPLDHDAIGPAPELAG